MNLIYLHTTGLIPQSLLRLPLICWQSGPTLNAPELAPGFLTNNRYTYICVLFSLWALSGCKLYAQDNGFEQAIHNALSNQRNLTPLLEERIKDLQAADVDVAESALLFLGKEKRVDLLLIALKNRQLYLVGKAADQLKELTTKEHIPALLDALRRNIITPVLSDPNKNDIKGAARKSLIQCIQHALREKLDNEMRLDDESTRKYYSNVAERIKSNP